MSHLVGNPEDRFSRIVAHIWMDFVLYRQLDTSSKDKSAVASFSLPDEPVSLQVSRPDSKDRVRLPDFTATHTKK